MSIPLRRLSPHIIKVKPRRLSEFRSSWEMVAAMLCAILAHEGYYKAGILHGNVSEDNIKILEGKAEDGGENVVFGVLLDIDRSDDCKPFRRTDKLPAKSTYNEEEEVD
ncbi:uncharacterized protein B0H18DRAFT_1122446 [Fomitopsis serialis]|uniref:uncharacterized protein n=1 Tax=Fomitopsis serialis TaxID=139415 RepID=UPI00200747A4|nr:uncharacterized protein B0H18DRAFT_958610 [Neoantrodia serialis]XP_047889588.1 uncharacterized protein B0H18DRAFT_1122446 [Neoantrodia serialis]KAH9916861.1 hypothetical protein B0H18DRAFT_958610 [Neoantrodia serialis]KAH9919524.1 hypothetical protein B0H18DRAFT_1122446 [Neoantrodia serialis]